MPRDTLPENAPACKHHVSLDGVGTTPRMARAVDRLGASAHPPGGTCRPVVLCQSGCPLGAIPRQTSPQPARPGTPPRRPGPGTRRGASGRAPCVRLHSLSCSPQDGGGLWTTHVPRPSSARARHVPRRRRDGYVARLVCTRSQEPPSSPVQRGRDAQVWQRCFQCAPRLSASTSARLRVKRAPRGGL
jgi:hypothetical protein